MKTRLNGLLVLLGAAFAGYVGVYTPLRDSAAHVATVHTMMKAAFFFPLMLLFGLGATLGGSTFAKAVDNGPATPAWMGKLSSVGWIIVAIGSVAGTALYVWLIKVLEARGYPTW